LLALGAPSDDEIELLAELLSLPKDCCTSSKLWRECDPF